MVSRGLVNPGSLKLCRVEGAGVRTAVACYRVPRASPIEARNGPFPSGHGFAGLLGGIGEAVAYAQSKGHSNDRARWQHSTGFVSWLPVSCGRRSEAARASKAGTASQRTRRQHGHS
jgi:hypothetical protein